MKGKVIDLVNVSESLCVGAELDRDGELEIIVGDIDSKDPNDTNYTWLDRSQILKLMTHLGKVLDDADEATTL